jgi:phage head maturation protease
MPTTTPTTTPTTIEASAAPSVIQATGTVEFQAAEGEGKRPTFTITGYTGSVMTVAGFYTPVVVDLAGLKASRDRIPILLDHDPSRIVGQATSTIDAAGVRLEGTITGDDGDAAKVVTHARNGFQWQASIGAGVVRREYLEPGKTATVNGRRVSGPLVIAREAILKETSFVAIGADSQTSASVAASNSPGNPHEGVEMKFEAWLQAKGFDPAALSDEQKTVLKAAYDAEQAPPPAPTPTSTPNTPVQAQLQTNLDDILAEAQREQERQDKITAMCKAAIDERPMLREELGRMARAAIEAKSSPTEFELVVLRAMRPQAPGMISRSNRKASAKVIEAAICMSAGLSDPEKHFKEDALEAASESFKHGLGLVELLMLAARENGHGTISARNVRGLLEASFARGQSIEASGFSTMSLPGILANVANKFLVEAFNHVESGWREISAVRPVNDFKTITSHSLTGDLDYLEIGPAGEIKHGTLGEETYTNRAKSYGRMLAITYQDIRNDDLGAFTAVPRRLGRGGALKINDVFWRAFMDNSAFFATGNGNYQEGATAGTNDSRLNIEGLTRAETLFLNQTDPDGKPLGVMPKILLVPNALKSPARQLMNSTEIRDTTANTSFGTSNPFAGNFRVVHASYLSNSSYTGYSATAWYLLADPNDVPVIEVALLDGRDMPIVESADADFDTLGIHIRGVHHFGVAKQEYRGGVKSKGAS